MAMLMTIILRVQVIKCSVAIICILIEILDTKLDISLKPTMYEVCLYMAL